MPNRNYVIASTKNTIRLIKKHFKTDCDMPAHGYLYVNPAKALVRWEPSVHKHPATHIGLLELTELLESMAPKQTKEPTEASQPAPGALGSQVGGGHYKGLKIQPAEYAEANGLSSLESKVIKYITRHEAKDGLRDLRKAIHCLELLIELIQNGTRDYPEELKNV